MTQVYPLNDSEAIFLSFNDPDISAGNPCSLSPDQGLAFQTKQFWDSLRIEWAACAPGKRAGSLDWPLELPDSGFDQFIFCLTIPPSVQVRFFTWDAERVVTPLGGIIEGSLSRQEIVLPIPPSSVAGLRMEVYAKQAGADSVSLIWFALRNSGLSAMIQKNKIRWNPEWPGLIRPVEEWGAPAFRRGLLFDAADLPALRAKKDLPGWSAHFAKLEASARKAMLRNPEEDLWISDYAPFTDERYVRQSERGRAPFYYESVKLALVGLVNEDEAMVRHALRYLMSMLHLKHWSPSGETRLQGSTWDQRCFTEEMMSTSVVLLLDWLDHALTPRARKLGHQMLWDRGLAIIERDMAKFEYVHHINQGPWFCRARVLGGLFLEEEWPRLGTDYAERAMRQLREGMDRYLLADGGMDEGPMYLLLTLETILVGLLAYSKKRSVDVTSLLPRAFDQVEDYLRTVAGSVPGTHIPDGDCASIYQNTDSSLILASLFPNSVYGELAEGAFLSDRPYTYSQHYVGTGIFSFIFGPDSVSKSSCAAAPFSLLPVAGLTGSYRSSDGHSLRLTFAGCKARPSHSHFDKGGFVAEVDGCPVFIDRGVVRYDDPRVRSLQRTEAHNTMAPSFDGRSTVEQVTAPVALIPDASGDAHSFRACLDLTPVWEGSMLQCEREILSSDLSSWIIKDSGVLVEEGRVVFFLQSHFPFEGDAGNWRCGPLTIQADWAERGDSSEWMVDCELRPVFRLRLWSPKLKEFTLHTSFARADRLIKPG